MFPSNYFTTRGQWRLRLLQQAQQDEVTRLRSQAYLESVYASEALRALPALRKVAAR